MKAGNKFKAVLVALLALTLIGGTRLTAVAQEAETTTDTTIQLMTTTATEVKTTLAERLAQRKEARATRLTTAQTTRLKARCQAAQTKLGTVGTRAEAAGKGRVTAYKAIKSNLDALVVKLDGRADTTNLETALTSLDEKITSFETDTNTFKQTLADLKELDCVADAAAFRASLESAKLEQAELATQAKAIRSYLTETIKPLLQTIRTSLSGGSN